MMKLRVTRAWAAAFSTCQPTAGQRRALRVSGSGGERVSAKGGGEAVGRATTCLSLESVPDCRNRSVIHLDAPSTRSRCGVAPSLQHGTDGDERHRGCGQKTSCCLPSRGSPQRCDTSDERRFVCSPPPAARSQRQATMWSSSSWGGRLGTAADDDGPLLPRRDNNRHYLCTYPWFSAAVSSAL